MPDPIPSLLTLLAAAGVPAQAALTARSFLPDDYRNVAFVDLAAMRAHGIWDELEVSLLKMVLTQIEKESGMSLRAIDRVTLVADPGTATPGARRPGDVVQLLVVEGNAALGVPRSVQQNADEVEIGGHTARSRRGELYVLPRPELYVSGHEPWVRPVLEGRARRGIPAPDLMSLLAGCDPLACFVFDVTTPLLRANLLAPAFPATSWADGEAPTFVCVRAVATGDPDDAHVTIEAIVRHVQDGPGVAVTVKAVEALRDRLSTMPELRAVKPVLAAMTTKTDRGDVVCTLDLGRVRNAIGHVAMLGSLLLVARTEPAGAEAAAPAAAVPVPVPVPKTAPKKR